MARQATRSARGLVALLIIVSACIVSVPSFSMLRGPVRPSPRTSRTTSRASAVEFPEFGRFGKIEVTDLRSIYYKIDNLQFRLRGERGSAPTRQDLDNYVVSVGGVIQYDQTLSADIQKLETLIHEAMEGVATEAEIEWLENVLETVGELKRELLEYRAAEGSSAATAMSDGLMPMTMFLAVGALMMYFGGSPSLENIENLRAFMG